MGDLSKLIHGRHFSRGKGPSCDSPFGIARYALKAQRCGTGRAFDMLPNTGKTRLVKYLNDLAFDQLLKLIVPTLFGYGFNKALIHQGACDESGLALRCNRGIG